MPSWCLLRRSSIVCAALTLVALSACGSEAVITSAADGDAAKQTTSAAAPWTIRIAAYGSWADNGDVSGFREDPAAPMGDAVKAVSGARVVVYSIKLIDYVFTDSTGGQQFQRQRAEFTEISEGRTDGNGRFELAVPTGDRYEVIVGPSHTRFNGGSYGVLPRAASDTSAARLLMGLVDHWPGQLPPATP
jgi:hypothetical protein